MSNIRILGSPAWRVVAMLWLVALLNYLDRLVITTMHDPIMDSIAMTEEQFGLLTSVFVWVYGALSPLGGYLADRFSRRKVILGSLVVWSAVTWLTGHAQTFEQLFWARALMGISEACYIPAALALITDYHRGRTRSLANGLHMSGIYAGAALGGIGGYLAQYGSWRTTFGIFGAIGIGYALVLLVFLKDAPQSGGVQRETDAALRPKITLREAMAALFSQRTFWMLMTLNTLVGLVNWAIYSWLPTYLKDQFALGLGAAGLSATAYVQVASFAGVVAGGAGADRWSRTNPRGRALLPSLGYLVAAPCLFLTASTNLFWLAVVGLIVFGVARGFYDANLMPLLRQSTDERFSATGYGFLNAISCAAGGIAPWAGGRLMDSGTSLGMVFQIAAAALLVTALLLLAVRPRTPKPIPVAPELAAAEK